MKWFAVATKYLRPSVKLHALEILMAMTFAKLYQAMKLKFRQNQLRNSLFYHRCSFTKMSRPSSLKKSFLRRLHQLPRKSCRCMVRRLRNRRLLRSTYVIDIKRPLAPGAISYPLCRLTGFPLI